MKLYWIALILIVSLGFFGLGSIVYKDFIQKPQPELFYLDADSMQIAPGLIADSARQRLSLVSIFPCDMKNTGNESIPWANLYVCRSNNPRDSLSGDTALVFIDIHTRGDLHDLMNADHYNVGIKLSQTFKKCRVMVPANQIRSIRSSKYRFAQVTLFDDWVSE